MGAASPARKALVVILDGLGDLPIPALGDATPLEAAHTPVLDGLAAGGLCGLVDPLRRGVVVGTQTGTASLMGLAPDVAATIRRGPIEAAGVGMELGPGDVALRVNFATVEADDTGLTVQDRRAGRILAGTDALAAAVNALDAIDPIDRVTATLESLGQHRGVLRLSGPGLSAAITDTDPGSAGSGQQLCTSEAVDPSNADAVRTAAALNRYVRRAHEALAAHSLNAERLAQGLLPANALLTRGAGQALALEGLVAEFGLRGAVVSADRTVDGVGSLLGLRLLTRASFTGLLDTDLAGKVAEACAALETHDVVWLHVKGADIAAHDRDPQAKRDFLERVDAALQPLVGAPWAIGVTADHTTDSSTGRHTEDPVPALLTVPGGRRDACVTFGERACAEGRLGRLRGYDYVRAVLAAAGMVTDAPPQGEPDPTLAPTG